MGLQHVYSNVTEAEISRFEPIRGGEEASPLAVSRGYAIDPMFPLDWRFRCAQSQNTFHHKTAAGVLCVDVHKATSRDITVFRSLWIDTWMCKMRRKSQKKSRSKMQAHLLGILVCIGHMFTHFQLLHLFVDRMHNFFAVKCGGRSKSNCFWRCRLSGGLWIVRVKWWTCERLNLWRLML